MLPLSALASQVQPSATLAAGAKAKELKAAGVKVYDFTLGEPDFTTPAHIRAAAQKAMETGQTRYTAAEGLPALRQAVAQTYGKRYGLDYAPEQVLISNGAKHSLHNALAALVGPGDEVIIPAPYWTSYSDLVLMTGAKPIVVNASVERQFKMLPPQLRAAITPRTKLLLINSPCNPTGTTYTRAELSALADVILDSPVGVLSDEIYENLTYGDMKPTCFAGLNPDLVDRTIIVSGASKTYAMTGWRLGWAIGPKPIIKAMGNIQSQQTGCPNSISQHAAVVAITGDQSCVTEMRNEFAARREIICSGLARLPKITITPPTGAFYAFFNVANYFGRTLHGMEIRHSADFCKAALEKVQVSVVPGSAFGAEGYVRLSFAASREELQGGLDQLAKLLAG